MIVMLAACGRQTDGVNIDAARFLANVTELSSDKYGGRAPMSEGERMTLDFVEGEFRKAGLEPLFDGSFLQPVPLISMEPGPETAQFAFNHAETRETLTYAEQYVAWTQRIEPQVTVADSEIVFVGYGIVAPEFGWNDYEGQDMKGKTALVLVNDPGFALKDAAMFKGRAMTYYGRWIYKLEEAARQGAAAVLLIHDTGPASYGWDTVRNSWTGPGFYLPPKETGIEPVTIASWIQFDVASALLATAGFNLEELHHRALSPAFEPIPLGTMLDAGIENTIIRGESFNVGGILPGSDAPGEAFIYTAHWDHIGTGHSDNPEDDVIFNGAVDNATGTSALIELAHAFKTLPRAPRRSVVFLAVTAEESGKLGSAWYAENPVFPMNKTVAGINMDALPVFGPTKDVVVIGYNSSELEDILWQAASAQNRIVKPEPNPERGSYYRSDHFNFAKMGVPMLYAKSGTEHREHGPEYIVEKIREYYDIRYHQPDDEVRDDWDIRGTMEEIELYLEIGREIADSESWPQWFEGNEFRAIREASLR
jgi:Zn-dependent M28 family amino/carboxypeptidase